MNSGKPSVPFSQMGPPKDTPTIVQAPAWLAMAGQQLDVPDDPRWPAFQAKFPRVLEWLAKRGRGCSFCQGECQQQYGPNLQQVRQWRAEFHALPSSHKDRELSWMFWHAGPGGGRADDASSAVALRVDTSSSGEEESTKLAPHSAEPAAQALAKAKAKVKSRADSKAKAKAKVKAGSMATAKTEVKAVSKAKATGKAKAKGKPSTLPPRLETSSSEADSGGRVNTSPSPSPSNDSDLDVAAFRATAAAAGPTVATPAQPRRPYNAGRPRQPKLFVSFLGKALCFQAARDFVGVGLSHLYRLKDGLADGRSDGAKRAKGPLGLAPQATKLPSVLRFLWQLYHSVGEGMPDKFIFERPGLDMREHSAALLA